MSKKEGAAALLAIKIAPPRTRRWVVSRERLVRKFHSVRECALICVQAPAGYGKTSLLARFRREWLATGACAAWLSLDEDDDAGRFVEALLFSTYTALGRPAPLGAVEQSASQRHRAARSDRHAARRAGRSRNSDRARARRRARAAAGGGVRAPSLPRVQSAAERSPHPRHPPPAAVRHLGSARSRPVRFVRRRRPDAFASRRLARCCRRAAAIASTPTRWRACTSGSKAGRWGCSSCSSMSRTRRIRSTRCAASRRRVRDSRRCSPTSSCRASIPQDVAFLTAIAPLEQFQAHLCAAITGRRDCAELLERLRNDTPVLQCRRGKRMAASARDVPRGAAAKVRTSFRKPTGWRCTGGRRNGCTEPECSNAPRITRSPRNATRPLTRGSRRRSTGSRRPVSVVAARDWLERLPESIVLGNDRLRIVAAWARALSHEPREAFPLTEPLIGPRRRSRAALRSAAGARRGGTPCRRSPCRRGGERARRRGQSVRYSSRSRGERRPARRSRAVARRHRRSADGARKARPAHDGCPRGLRELLRRVLRWPELPSRCASGGRGARPRAGARAGERRFRRKKPAGVPRRGGTGGRIVGSGPAGRSPRPTLANRLDVIERTAVPEAVALAYVTLARVALDRPRRRARARSAGGLCTRSACSAGSRE